MISTYSGQISGLPRWLSGKESACSAGDVSLISGLGGSPGEGNGKPLQYSCLGNRMDRGACGLQSMGLQRVGHNLETKQQQGQMLLQVFSYDNSRCISSLTI